MPNGNETGLKDAPAAVKEDKDDLAERILSGQYGDVGSTKEKMTRPMRKALAQAPAGAGGAG
jgi:hypothetical protein